MVIRDDGIHQGTRIYHYNTMIETSSSNGIDVMDNDDGYDRSSHSRLIPLRSLLGCILVFVFTIHVFVASFHDRWCFVFDNSSSSSSSWWWGLTTLLTTSTISGWWITARTTTATFLFTIDRGIGIAAACFTCSISSRSWCRGSSWCR